MLSGLGKGLAVARLSPSHIARLSLISAAALPFLAYLLFLLYCLAIDVCRAFLILPGKIDKLAAKDEEQKSGQQP
jgi:hypothetical protein